MLRCASLPEQPSARPMTAHGMPRSLASATRRRRSMARSRSVTGLRSVMVPVSAARAASAASAACSGVGGDTRRPPVEPDDLASLGHCFPVRAAVHGAVMADLDVDSRQLVAEEGPVDLE